MGRNAWDEHAKEHASGEDEKDEVHVSVEGVHGAPASVVNFTICDYGYSAFALVIVVHFDCDVRSIISE